MLFGQDEVFVVRMLMLGCPCAPRRPGILGAWSWRDGELHEEVGAADGGLGVRVWLSRKTRRNVLIVRRDIDPQVDMQRIDRLRECHGGR